MEEASCLTAAGDISDVHADMGLCVAQDVWMQEVITA